MDLNHFQIEVQVSKRYEIRKHTYLHLSTVKNHKYKLFNTLKLVLSSRHIEKSNLV